MRGGISAIHYTMIYSCMAVGVRKVRATNVRADAISIRTHITQEIPGKAEPGLLSL